MKKSKKIGIILLTLSLIMSLAGCSITINNSDNKEEEEVLYDEYGQSTFGGFLDHLTITINGTDLEYGEATFRDFYRTYVAYANENDMYILTVEDTSVESVQMVICLYWKDTESHENADKPTLMLILENDSNVSMYTDWRDAPVEYISPNISTSQVWIDEDGKHHDVTNKWTFNGMTIDLSDGIHSDFRIVDFDESEKETIVLINRSENYQITFSCTDWDRGISDFIIESYVPDE